MAIRRAGRAFWERLASEIEGNVAFDLFSRARYATDASMYQCFPAGVVAPKSAGDVAVVLEMAREEGLPVIARGGGTSTAGQALGEGVVLDFSKHLRGIVSIDAENLRCTAEPGCTPAAVNAAAMEHGLTFPVAIGSARQATIGGMLGNNASGIRALRYGSMRDNVASADALLSDGHRVLFNAVSETDGLQASPGRDRLLDLLQFGELHERAIATIWPLRAPGTPEAEAYDLRTLLASSADQNMARLLAGAEGTLAIATKIELKLVRRPANRAIGVCRFTSLAAALRLVPKVMVLNPSAIELMDRTLLEFLAFQAGGDAQAARLLQGEPEAILIVEFDEENPVANTRLLKSLDGYAADGGAMPGLIEILGEKARGAFWRLRKEAIIRAWSLKSAAQPLSFLEDGAVPIKNLGAYAAALTALFERHGVRSAIYGQAGQGALHVRPILNLRHAEDIKRMRDLAVEMAELLKSHGGVLTAGHGIGLARSEMLERRLGAEAIGLFSQLKTQLDPHWLLNPGKILRAPDFDERALLRAPRQVRPDAGTQISLTWGPSASASRALDHARRCQGLSLCRTAEPGLSCPSFNATHDERDSPRGRANSARLALSGQLGAKALGSPALIEAMQLCVSCKACKSSCPFAIDIAKMKVEVLAAARADGYKSKALDLYARLPEYTDKARRRRALLALRDFLPGLPRLTERWTGIAADRPWPRWAGRRFKAPKTAAPGQHGTVALFADIFNRSFEPANLRAAASVLSAAGYAVVAFAGEKEEDEPLCCGRTYFDAGYIDEARKRALRITAAAAIYAGKGIPVIGLEPASVLMMRDEYAALGLALKENPPVLLFEEFVAAQLAQGKFALPLKSIEADVLLHSHCHERAAGLEGAAAVVLKLVPELNIIEGPAGCCGLNGITGMTPETLDASFAMAELSLFPAIRKAGRDAFIAATAYSCRKQILDGLGRTARHPAMILELALKGDKEIVG